VDCAPASSLPAPPTRGMVYCNHSCELRCSISERIANPEARSFRQRLGNGLTGSARPYGNHCHAQRAGSARTQPPSRFCRGVRQPSVFRTRVRTHVAEPGRWCTFRYRHFHAVNLSVLCPSQPLPPSKTAIHQENHRIGQHCWWTGEEPCRNIWQVRRLYV